MPKYRYSRFLVTGGAGAIGSQLTNRLIEGGHRVTVLDDESSGRAHLVHPEARYIRGTIEDDIALEGSFEQGVDAVIHCAANFANQNSVDNPRKDLCVNGLGLIKVLEYAHKYNVRKLLYTSSSCVYGKSADMSEANRDFDLETPYAISKLLGEHYCEFWSRFHKLNTVIIRIFNNYGPGELPGQYRNVIPNFFQLAITGNPLIITGTGQETRDFNFVADTTEGILAAITQDTEPGEVFNIGSGKETTVLEVAKMINEIADNKAGIDFRPQRSWDQVAKRCAIIEKAKTRLGYAPSTQLEVGLVKTYHWLTQERRERGFS